LLLTNTVEGRGINVDVVAKYTAPLCYTH